MRRAEVGRQQIHARDRYGMPASSRRRERLLSPARSNPAPLPRGRTSIGIPQLSEESVGQGGRKRGCCLRTALRERPSDPSPALPMCLVADRVVPILRQPQRVAHPSSPAQRPAVEEPPSCEASPSKCLDTRLRSRPPRHRPSRTLRLALQQCLALLPASSAETRSSDKRKQERSFGIRPLHGMQLLDVARLERLTVDAPIARSGAPTWHAARYVAILQPQITTSKVASSAARSRQTTPVRRGWGWGIYARWRTRRLPVVDCGVKPSATARRQTSYGAWPPAAGSSNTSWNTSRPPGASVARPRLVVGEGDVERVAAVDEHQPERRRPVPRRSSVDRPIDRDDDVLEPGVLDRAAEERERVHPAGAGVDEPVVVVLPARPGSPPSRGGGRRCRAIVPPVARRGAEVDRPTCRSTSRSRATGRRAAAALPAACRARPSSSGMNPTAARAASSRSSSMVCKVRSPAWNRRLKPPIATWRWSSPASPRRPRWPPAAGSAAATRTAPTVRPSTRCGIILNSVSMEGVVVIGEGEKDEAPMLFNGEEIGAGGPACDIAVDPIDGTTLTSLGRNNAISVIAVSERGTMFDPGPCVYMDKIAVGPEAAEAIDLDAPVTDQPRSGGQGARRGRRRHHRGHPRPRPARRHHPRSAGRRAHGSSSSPTATSPARSRWRRRAAAPTSSSASGARPKA